MVATRSRSRSPKAKITPAATDDIALKQTELVPQGVFGYTGRSVLLPAAKVKMVTSRPELTILYAASKTDALRHLEKLSLPVWQLHAFKTKPREINWFTGEKGPQCVIVPSRPDARFHERDHGIPGLSPFSQGRDLIGQVLGAVEMQDLGCAWLRFAGIAADERQGVLVGCDMASYRFAKYRTNKRLPNPDLVVAVIDVPEPEIEAAQQLAAAVNMARHLTNTPPSELRPDTYANAMVKVLQKKPGVTVTVLDEAAIKKEGMNLLAAVGQGAAASSRLVHIKYRPAKMAKANTPAVFVGKGITFDTGGLDLKPADAMRLMKKDMGGSAAVAGLAWWVVTAELGLPCDFYLALAENAIGPDAFKPSDVVTAHNGLTVEIDNTDAEGRLVLADAMAYALDQLQDEKPRFLIDVATLTGAVKVGLGSDLAGLFSNHNGLAEQLLQASIKSGDPAWRLPLYSPYEAQLRSPFADLKNSSVSRFGGAITAALFLEKFVGQVPWAHFDIFAWTDYPRAAWREPGGSGQAVLLLSAFLRQMPESKRAGSRAKKPAARGSAAIRK